MSYCASRFQTRRRATHEVLVGSVGVGGSNPVRIQSMTTSDTQDIDATVRQSIALAEVGCEIVRVTAPNVPAAKCLADIRKKFSAAGFAHIPLVADIHFLPSAAMEAVEHVEKIRVNPGNYADKKKFAVLEYTDADYDRELQRLHDAFSPLVKRARALGRSLRIGTNHGSLSDRIMNRYGDTPLGMVESALEFLRIARAHSFDQIILSMKASNPKVMIEAYRLLVARMQQENMTYPLHLGVTEAGDGEDGRIKSAIGIGSLLLDGLGDTIRVSLTEDSVYEIPVARALADKAMSLWATPNPKPQTPNPASAPTANSQRPTANSQLPTPNPEPETRNAELLSADSIDPFHFTRRETTVLHLGPGCTTGPEQPPRVIVRAPSAAALPQTLAQLSTPRLADTPAEGVLVAIHTPADLQWVGRTVPGEPRPGATPRPAYAPSFTVLELAPTLTPEDLIDFPTPNSKPQTPNLPPHAPGVLLLRTFTAADAHALPVWTALARRHGHTLACEISPADFPALSETLRTLGDTHLLFTLSALPAPRSPLPASSAHAVGAYRQLAEHLRALGSRAPIWIRNTAATAIRGDNTFLSKLLEASILTGSLLCDGLGDLVSIETEADPLRATTLAYNVLQGAGARISKTEFVACPSCGRTLFDLQTTTQRIRSKTGHLKGVKLAIMGCIVNGPGEMADADFGYVGGAPGKINLYVGKTCVQYNIPQAEADDRLIALIKEHGKWFDPAPQPVA